MTLKVGTVALAYNEERLIGPHLDQIPCARRVVLVSTRPWNGEPGPLDGTAEIAYRRGAEVHAGFWAREHEQRNAGQELLADCDWILHLDPDEFFLKEDWRRLLRELERAKGDAYTVAEQRTYWRDGYVIDPPEPYRQLFAVRPHVSFTDCRDSSAGAWWQLPALPVGLHHFSWSRPEHEIRSKLAHYGHAKSIPSGWFDGVWKSWTPSMQNLHPTCPATLKRAIPCEIPRELHGLAV